MIDDLQSPELIPGTADHEGALMWRWPKAMQVLSSAPVGGGQRTTRWLLNIGVPGTYARTDLGQHSREIAASLGLIDDGVAFFTAAKTAQVRRGQVDGVVVDATVGIGKPTWAADSSGGWTPWEPGTVNIVVQMAEPLSPAAAVNGVITVTEAKSQAFVEAGIGGTGTASDAVALVWPTASTADPHDFAGPRSDIGSRIALATHQAVTAGIDDWLRNNRG